MATPAPARMPAIEARATHRNRLPDSLLIASSPLLRWIDDRRALVSAAPGPWPDTSSTLLPLGLSANLYEDDLSALETAMRIHASASADPVAGAPSVPHLRLRSGDSRRASRSRQTR